MLAGLVHTYARGECVHNQNIMQDIKIVRKNKIQIKKKKTGLKHIVIFLITVLAIANVLAFIGSYLGRKDNGAVWIHGAGSVKMAQEQVYDSKALLSALKAKKAARVANIKAQDVKKLTKKEKMVLKGQNFVLPPVEFQSIIEKKALKYGVDKSLMKAISYCESDYRAKVKNSNTNGTHDSGVAQINDIHLPELKKLGFDRNNPAHAYEFMAILLKRNGTSDYKASEICWTEAVKVASSVVK